MLKSFFTIIRWPNLLIVAGIQSVVFYTLLDSSQSVVSIPDLILLILVTLCITAAGNVINDYHDSEMDMINRPARVVVGKVWPKGKVLRLYKIIVALGAAGALYFAFRMHLLLYFPVYLLAVVGLQVYSTHFKCRPVMGNLWVAIYCGAVVLIMAATDLLHGNGHIIKTDFWYYILFAFLITYYRENIKDLEDVNGDAQLKCKTFVVVNGMKAGKILTVAAGVIALISLLFWDNTASDRNIKLGLLVLQGAIVGSLALIWWARDAGYFSKASALIKFVMIGGTLLLLLQN
jgi:4-hydroxybenzoate polyprenyltransferase